MSGAWQSRLLPLIALSVTSCAPASVLPPPVPMVPGESGLGVNVTTTLGQLGYLGYFVVHDATPSRPSAGATIDVHAVKTRESGKQIAAWASLGTYVQSDGYNPITLPNPPAPSFGLTMRRPLGEGGERQVYGEFGVGWAVIWLGLPVSQELGPDRWIYTDPTLALGYRSALRVPVGYAKENAEGDVTSVEVSAGLGWGTEPSGPSGPPWSVGVGVGYQRRSD